MIEGESDRGDGAAQGDATLLRAHVEGDPDAFAVLVARHQDRMWSIALRIMGNPDDAADALQDALIAAFRRAGTYRGEVQVTTWLHRVVVNACLNRVRIMRPREPVEIKEQRSVESEALRNVSAALRAEPATPIPEAVAHRLHQVVTAESAARQAAVRSVLGHTGARAAGDGESTATWTPRPTLGAFGEDLKEPPKSRWALPALAAAAAAAVLGLGAYVISANTGHNEPPVMAAINSNDLAAEARALQQVAGGLSSHRFSQAWDCAREVTDGRITGLAASTVDGTPALIVYTQADDATMVTVVTGCGMGTPSAGPSAILPN